jgi:uncharacterized coiled-coil protein SlyX
MSKSEQKYMQRVSDLIIEAYERYSRLAYKFRLAEAQRAKVEMSQSVLSNRLKTCVKHLHIYRRRAHASEMVTATDFKHGLRHEGKLIGILRKALSDTRVRLYSTTDLLLAERRDRHLVDIGGATAIKKMKFYEARIAELETKGPFMLRAKEEALASLDERIRCTEESCKKWFKNELPRLFSGLTLQPATAHARTSEMSPSSLLDGLASSSGGNAGFASGFDLPVSGSLGGEDTSSYALVQALCAARAIQTAQEVKLTSVEERNFILKEKIISLQGVLMKWQGQMRATAADETTLDPSATEQSATRKVYEQSAELSRLQEQVRSLSEIVVSLEEENVDARARCEHALERSDELKKLLDSVVGEEQVGFYLL